MERREENRMRKEDWSGEKMERREEKKMKKEGGR